MGAFAVRTAQSAVPFVDLQRLHAEVMPELRRAFEDVVAKGAFTLGEAVERFERDFASYIGVSDAIGVASGTDALHLALRACGVQPGDEVITAANTFTATAEAIVMAGATPVFVDVDEDTLLATPEAIEAAITERTRAVVPVHLHGQPVDMDAVMDIAARHGIKVVEDACQAHGARCGVFRAGGFGDAGCFSFYPGKNLGALGDGGIVTTSDPMIAERVRLLRSHGEDAARMHLEVGYCSRLHGLQAAFLSEKLMYLDEWNARRQKAASLYDDLLADTPVHLPGRASGRSHVFHLYVIRTRDRDEVRARLADRGVQTGIHYALPLHLEPAYEYLGYRRGEFPVAESSAASMISLPMHPHIEYSEVAVVADAIKEVING